MTPPVVELTECYRVSVRLVMKIHTNTSVQKYKTHAAWSARLMLCSGEKTGDAIISNICHWPYVNVIDDKPLWK